jgi:ankyrin repeat protein
VRFLKLNLTVQIQFHFQFSKGADVNAVSRSGITPLTLANVAKQKDITELLIKQGGHE